MPTPRATSPQSDHPADRDRGARGKACLLAGVGLLVVGGVLADWGSETAFGLGLMVVIERWLVGGTLAGAYLLAAFGYGGMIAKRLLGGASGGAAIAMAIGLAAMLTLSHALGVLGLLGANAIGRTVAIATIALGVGLAVWAWRSGASAGSVRFGRLHMGGLVCFAALPALGVLWVASAVPPGWLWGSEFGGYDTLSYHLQLPQEWLESGRLWPLAHNVYSFLPGYAEAAWLHMACASFAPGEPGGLSAPRGMLTGAPVYGAQMLSAMVAVVAAWIVGATAAAFVSRTFDDCAHEPSETSCRADAGWIAAWFAGLLVLATPWSVVTGSMAYHEMYVVALGAGAMLVSILPGVDPARRWLLAAALVGVACGAKPTAILMLTPPVAMALLWTAAQETRGQRLGERAHRLARPVAVGLVVGLVALSPWLVRNAAASGNPVFPFASGVFGTAHWSPAQHERYAAAHRAEGSIGERLQLAVWPEPAGEGASAQPLRQRHRGMLHPQWGLLFPLAGAAAAGLLLTRATRGAGAVLGLGLLAQLAVWLACTHVQSRFLLPSIVLAAPVAGLAIGALAACGRSIGVVMVGAGVLVLAQSMTTAYLFATEREGRPVLPLLSGVEGYTGDLARETLPRLGEGERDALMSDQSPVALANLMLPAGSRLMLLGDATPLYLRVAHDYRTVWDAWPVGDEAGVPPHRWSNALADAGATHALVNLAELSRLERSGYVPPGVGPASASLWLAIVEEQREGRVLRAWPRGSVLLELHRDRLLRPERRP
ncbi:MAG: hypothetical protein EA378_02285 [Phycisphaerales bacterium]|nr:MAG: hypothetical protein EA378_02285 [Phycisphaerales bacterium]